MTLLLLLRTHAALLEDDWKYSNCRGLVEIFYSRDSQAPNEITLRCC